MDKPVLNGFDVVDVPLNSEGVVFPNRDGEVFAANAELLV
jgi:hypothetical protein